MTIREQQAARYAEWLKAQRLLFGFPDEIAAYATRLQRGVANSIPPVERWDRILPTVHVVERLRETFGPTVIHSAYRSPPYNRMIGGAVHSWHMENRALDVSCATGTPSDWAGFLRGLRNDGVFTGGIGTYSTFVHVDTRGTNADWVG